MTERRYLRDVQYADGANLNARAELHRRFSVNRGSFHRWIFDQVAAPPTARVLDVGCGPGYVWAANLDRVPAGWTAVLADFSPGMVTTARDRLGHRFRYEVADAEALPHPTGAFDAAMANHMLYHVPGRARAVRELARVLRPGGALYAVTNGRDHLIELDQLVARSGPAAPDHFTLENGAEQLGSGFADVELRLWKDALEVTDADAIVAYGLSLSPGHGVDVDRLRRDAALAIEREGVFKVRKATGMFVARAPLQSRS
jgi:SAM-dependent methyltransferase